MELSAGLRAGPLVDRLHVDGHHHVRSARLVVHVGGGNGAVRIGHINELENVVDRFDRNDSQVRDVHALLALPDLELPIADRLREQVPDLFVVDLEDGDGQRVLDLLGTVLRRHEQRLKGA